MRAGKASRTAEYMALFRAVESCRRPGARLFFDPFASGFLRPGLRAVALAARLPGAQRAVERLIDRRAGGPRISALVRTRLIDEALGGALGDGARQLVILGAGFDSRAYRVKQLATLRVFEVDHPSTQRAKRARLARMLASPPAHVSFVALDFAHEHLGQALARAGYDPAERTFAIWEGVTNYLDAAAVDATLSWFAANSGPRSRISFTYVERGLIDGSKHFAGAEPWLRRVRRAGEPFTFGLEPTELGAYLSARGLRLLSDASTADALARLAQRAEQPPPAFYRVALAERD